MNNLQKIFIVFCTLIFTACGQETLPTEVKYLDQCKRAELFQACLTALPAGPQATQYNDWSEVVEACAGQAYRSSIVDSPASIPPACKVKL